MLAAGHKSEMLRAAVDISTLISTHGSEPAATFVLQSQYQTQYVTVLEAQHQGNQLLVGISIADTEFRVSIAGALSLLSGSSDNGASKNHITSMLVIDFSLFQTSRPEGVSA